MAVALAAAGLLVLGASAATPPVEAVAFTVDYETGSIPPPSNHVDRLEGRFDKDAPVVDYSRTYRFRDSLTAEELAALSPDEQDVAWQGQLTAGWARPGSVDTHPWRQRAAGRSPQGSVLGGRVTDTA